MNPPSPRTSMISRLWRAGAPYLVPACWVWVCWACAHTWLNDANYSHGLFIPGFIIYFLYRDLPTLDVDASTATAPRWWILLAILPVCILCLETIRLTPIAWRPVFWGIWGITSLWTLALVQLKGNRKALLLFISYTVILAGALPWPTFIEVTATRHLAEMVAQVSGELLFLTGIYCQVDGVIIWMTNGVVGVDETCSGLRSLQASLAVALIVGHWFQLSWVNRCLLFLPGIVLALVFNLIRSFVLCLIVHYHGQTVFDEWHDVMGTVSMVGVTIAIFAIGTLFPRPPAPAQNDSLDLRQIGRRLLLLLTPPSGRVTTWVYSACLMAFLLPHLWFAVKAGGEQVIAPLISQDVWSEETRTKKIPDRVAAILNSTFGEYRTLPSGPLAYHLFWKTSPNNGTVFYHRPDVCVPGGGWVQKGPATLAACRIGGNPAVLHAFEFSRIDSRMLIAWFAWVDGQPVQYQGNPGSHIQLDFIPEMIRLGKRAFAVEILGVAFPVEKSPEDPIPFIMREISQFGIQAEHSESSP